MAPVVSPLVVIVGETASGKSALAMSLAKMFDGEIICADSRTVYKGMDIGTAKPSTTDQLIVPHHLVDVVLPDELFTAANFQRLAYEAIDDITARGKLPIMVGGTGLYIDSVLYDFSFRPAVQDSGLEQLEDLSITELQTLIKAKGYTMPVNTQNPRHLIRTLRAAGRQAEQKPLRSNTLVLGMVKDRNQLNRDIRKRVDIMIQKGLEQEAKSLLGVYGADCRSLQTIGYQEFVPYFAEDTSLQAVAEQITTASRQYAKRQRTWFRRNKSIQWVEQQIQAVDLVTTFLNK